MGIKNLMKWIQKNAPGSIKNLKQENLFGKTIAIDASLSIYQFLVSVRHTGQQLVDSEGNTTSHLQGILSRTVRLIQNGIRPFYVFDGKPPDLKSGELQKRADRRKEAEVELQKALETGDQEAIDRFSRRTVRLDHNQVLECQKLLNLLGVPFVVAPCEAEAECAALAKAGKAFGVATEDMDALAFATPYLIRHLSYSSGSGDEVIQISFEIMLKESGLKYEEFVDFCILCGCDYCDTIKGIGPKRAYGLIQDYHNIEEVIKHIDQSKYPIPEDFDYPTARKLFTNHEVITDVNLEWKSASEEGLKEFLCEQKGFSETRIDAVIKNLKKARSGGRQVTMDSFFSTIPSNNQNIKKKDIKKNQKSDLNKKKK